MAAAGYSLGLIAVAAAFEVLPSEHERIFRWILVLALMLVACLSPTEPFDTEPCPQTYEFGNHGCARFVVLVEGPPEPWPERARWSVRARGVDPLVQDGALGDAPVAGRVRLTVTLMGGLPASFGDTASYWVAARLLEIPRPTPVGEPLPVFAADSALRVARFAPVGQVPVVDTVRLRLRRPGQ